MANRKENRYSVPKHTGHHDISAWLIGKPFFLSSAIKHMWRGWNEIDDLAKAVNDLRLARLGETGTHFELMAADLCLLFKTATAEQRPHLLLMGSLVNAQDGLGYPASQEIGFSVIDNTIIALNSRIAALSEFGEAVHGDIYNA